MATLVALALAGLIAAGPRVVSLHDVTTEIVVALGAVDRLVGAASPVDQPAAVKRAVARVPEAGDAESVLALHPDVLLGMAVVEQRSPDLVRLLRARKVDVLLGDPHRLEDTFALVEQVGERLGVQPAAAALVARLKGRVAALPTRRPIALPVFVYDCCDPAFTAGGRTVLSDLITRAGGRNVFAGLDTGWTHVSWEEVLARRPRLVVIDDYDFAGQGDVAGKRKTLQAIPRLGAVPTVVLPLGEALGGIRSVDGLERLAAAIAGIK